MTQSQYLVSFCKIYAQVTVLCRRIFFLSRGGLGLSVLIYQQLVLSLCNQISTSTFDLQFAILVPPQSENASYAPGLRPHYVIFGFSKSRVKHITLCVHIVLCVCIHAPGWNDRGILFLSCLFVCLSVCLFVCLLSTLKFAITFEPLEADASYLAYILH